MKLSTLMTITQTGMLLWGILLVVIASYSNQPDLNITANVWLVGSILYGAISMACNQRD